MTGVTLLACLVTLVAGTYARGDTQPSAPVTTVVPQVVDRVVVVPQMPNECYELVDAGIAMHATSQRANLDTLKAAQLAADQNLQGISGARTAMTKAKKEIRQLDKEEDVFLAAAKRCEDAK